MHSIFHLVLRDSRRFVQQGRGHVSDGAEGQAGQDPVVCGLQLHQSIQDCLAVDMGVELGELGHQRIQAAHGAEVLRYTGPLGSGKDAHHPPGLDAGVEDRWVYQLGRQNDEGEFKVQ